MENVADCVNNALNTAPDSYNSFEEFLSANPGYEETTLQTLNADEKAALQSYSGYRFAWINSVARGFWDYEKMGRKTPELEEEIKEKTRNIISALDKAPAAEKGFVTYRGTNLDGFKTQGIGSLEDLAKLKGQFMFEQGFTSTALNRDNSFVNHEANDLWIGESNIEMRYHIPAGAKGVIALTSTELSHSTGQTEVLIDHDTLEYVSDVNYAEDGHAVLDVVMIPSSVYDY